MTSDLNDRELIEMARRRDGLRIRISIPHAQRLCGIAGFKWEPFSGWESVYVKDLPHAEVICDIATLCLDLADSRRRVEELRLWAESEADRTYGLYKTGSGPERGSAYFEGMSDAFSLMNARLGASGETPAKGSEGDKK